MKNSRAALIAASLAAGAGMLRCGGEKTTSATVVTLAPAPTPTPTPSATPTPSPSASSQGCRVNPRDDCSLPGGGGCCREESDRFGESVELSIRDVQAARPELFDGDVIRNESDEELVVELVARRLEQRFGLCAKPGSPVEDEVAVKNSNEFSEQFDIVLSNHRVNVHGYQVTCRPARF